MPSVERPIVPEDDALLPAWLCKDQAHVREYLELMGQKWVNVARILVHQVFTFDDPGLANQIGWSALSDLFEAAKTGSLKNVSRLNPYMNRIVKNKTIDEFKRYIRQKPLAVEESEGSGMDDPEPFECEESSALMEKIEACLQNLAEGERIILTRRMVDLDDPPEPMDIATAMGISDISVRVQLSSGRLKMKECLAKKGVLL